MLLQNCRAIDSELSTDYFQTPSASKGAVRRTVRERWTRGAGAGPADATTEVLTGVVSDAGVVAEAATAVAGALGSVALFGGML